MFVFSHAIYLLSEYGRVDCDFRSLQVNCVFFIPANYYDCHQKVFALLHCHFFLPLSPSLNPMAGMIENCIHVKWYSIYGKRDEHSILIDSSIFRFIYLGRTTFNASRRWILRCSRNGLRQNWRRQTITSST